MGRSNLTDRRDLTDINLPPKNVANTANHRESLSYQLAREDRPGVLVIVSLLHLLLVAMAEEVVLGAVEVDPKKLISKNGVIGYEKAEGFQAMTNFDVAITGFVAESSGAVIGYLAEVRLDIIDDDAENTSRYL